MVRRAARLIMGARKVKSTADTHTLSARNHRGADRQEQRVVRRDGLLAQHSVLAGGRKPKREPVGKREVARTIVVEVVVKNAPNADVHATDPFK